MILTSISFAQRHYVFRHNVLHLQGMAAYVAHILVTILYRWQWISQLRRLSIYYIILGKRSPQNDKR